MRFYLSGLYPAIRIDRSMAIQLKAFYVSMSILKIQCYFFALVKKNCLVLVNNGISTVRFTVSLSVINISNIIMKKFRVLKFIVLFLEL